MCSGRISATMSLSLVRRGSPYAIEAIDPVTRYGIRNRSKTSTTVGSGSYGPMGHSPHDFFSDLFFSPVRVAGAQIMSEHTPSASPEVKPDGDPLPGPF